MRKIFSWLREVDGCFSQDPFSFFLSGVELCRVESYRLLIPEYLDVPWLSKHNDVYPQNAPQTRRP